MQKKPAAPQRRLNIDIRRSPSVRAKRFKRGKHNLSQLDNIINISLLFAGQVAVCDEALEINPYNADTEYIRVFLFSLPEDNFLF